MEASGKRSLPGMLGIMESELPQILFNGIRKITLVTIIISILYHFIFYYIVLYYIDEEDDEDLVVWVEILMVT